MTIRPAAVPSVLTPETRVYLQVTVVVAIGMVAGAVLEWVPTDPSPWRWLPLSAAYLIGGAPILSDTIAELRKGRLSIDFLMGAAALGAASVGQPLEGVILIFLFSLSNTLEAYAMGRTRRAIEELMKIHPEEATLLDAEGREAGQVPAASLEPGQRILIRPGERIAADGRVSKGRSDVDQSAITGEAQPVTRGTGDEVFAGSINGGGVLTVTVTRPASETMLARIVRMVEEAREKRAPAQEFIDRFAHPYTILVLVGSGLTILGGVALVGATWGEAVYRGMTLLVVASPCALVISTPAAVLSAIANGARNGILFKGGAVLDRTGDVDVVAFDKTGTLTMGQPRLLALRAEGIPEDELLSIAAAVEAASEHHIATAVLDAARERGRDPSPVEEFRALPGEGVEGRQNGQLLWVGNRALAARQSAGLPEALDAWMIEQAGQSRSVVLTGVDDRVMGAMAFGDRVRPGARETIRRLKDVQGIRRVLILSGDHPDAVRAIAAELGADEVRAGLLPHEKVEALRAISGDARGVVMVGDGVNDAPAMVAASVGVAMGAAGTDVAIETADVVLMGDDLPKIEYLVELGRRARRIVRQNVWFSVVWMGLLVVTASVVGLPLTVAVVAHEGSTLLVVLNGLRLLAGHPVTPTPG